MPEVTLADHDRSSGCRSGAARSRRNSMRRTTPRVDIECACSPAPTAVLLGLLVARTEHGVTNEKHIHREFFESAEYRSITDLAQDARWPAAARALTWPRATQRQDIGSFKQAIKWLLEQARKGQLIQRYKGLGEMNPGAALGHDDQSADATSDSGAHRGCAGRQRHLRDADGRSGRAAARVHREERTRSRQSGHLDFISIDCD